MTNTNVVNFPVWWRSVIASLLCVFGFMTQDGGFGRTFPFLPPKGFGIPMIVVGALFFVWAMVLVVRRAKAMSEAAQREWKR